MPSRPSLILAVSVLCLMFIVHPVSLKGFETERNDQIRTRAIRFSLDPNIEIGEYGGFEKIEMKLETADHLDIGLSDGSLFEQVVDPTPGSPMIPWFATTISTPVDIETCLLEPEKVLSFRTPEGIMNIPQPADHWEDPDPYTSFDGRAYPERNTILEPIGYRMSNSGLNRVYSLWFTPFSLESEGTLDIITSGTIEITMSGEMTGPSTSRTTGDPSDVPGTLSIDERIDVPPEYLIITGSENVEPLKELSEWRNRKGLATSVVDVDHILGNYSGSSDPADLLRQYIDDVRLGWGRLKYVLLAGDWQTIPVKYVKDSDPSGWDDGRIPADSFYQCLDGTWDLDGDGIFGEVGDLEDIIPDIVVSRLAIDDPDVWEGKVEQLIGYETGSSDWSDRSLLIGANTHNEGDGSQFSDYLDEKYLSSAYGEVTKLYEDRGTLSRSSIDENLGQGAAFVQFVDHGGPLEWCDDYGAGIVYRDRDARNLDNNDGLPFVSALACLTTWFDDSSGCPYNTWENCLGEAFTENVNGGAIGYMGSSRVSVGIINTNVYLPYDNGLIEDVARQLGGLGNYVSGDVHTGAKSHYAEIWGNKFAKENNPEVSLCWLEFTLLGEPATDLWTENGPPLSCSVEHEDDLDPHITVTVTDDGGSPVENANVTLQNFERGIFQRGTTDSDGRVIFDLILDWFCDINLTITKHDMVPFRGFIRISDVIPPTTEMISDPAVPDGENGWFLTDPSIRLVPDERGVVHYRMGDGGQMTLNSTMNYTLPSLNEGINNIHFFSEDEAGNLEMERHITVMVDTRDPDIRTFVNPSIPDGENGWYVTEPSITIEKVHSEGSPETIFYEMYGETFRYNGPFYIPEGEHTIEIWSIDDSGRISNRSVEDFRVDLTSPLTEMELDPPLPDGENGWYVSLPRVTFIPSEEGCLVEYRTSPSSDFAEAEGSTVLPEGDYWLEYRSIDHSGNMEETERVRIKVDTNEPELVSRLYPPEPDGENGIYISKPEIFLSWTDENEASILYRMDDSDWKEWTRTMDIPDGNHILEAKVVDPAGLESATEVFDLVVDTVYPDTFIEITGSSKGGWYRANPSIELISSEQARIFFAWDDGRGFSEYSGPFRPDIDEGEAELTYYSVDVAGNREDESYLKLRMDTVKPEPVLKWTVEDGKVSLDASGSSDGNEMTYRYLIDGKLLRDWSSDPDLSVELDPGTYTITLEVRDVAGNTESRSSTINVDGPPYILMIVITSVLLALLLVILFIIIRRRRTDESTVMQRESYHPGNYQGMVFSAIEEDD